MRCALPACSILSAERASPFLFAIERTLHPIWELEAKVLNQAKIEPVLIQVYSVEQHDYLLSAKQTKLALARYISICINIDIDTQHWRFPFNASGLG